MFRDKISYSTTLGTNVVGDSIESLERLQDNSVNLVVTSPPFALQRKKEYGNESQEEYVEWFSRFGEVVMRKLTPDGSFVVDLGGAYRKGVPVRSLYNYRVLIHFCDNLGFHLAEEFFWYNPSKLPSPIEWVNKRKIRAKDAVNTVWWFSKTELPKADVRNVLTEYSDRMKKLLKDKDKYYKAKERPSGHDISDKFGKDNGGAIPPNLLQIPNSESNTKYLKTCKKLGIKGHPARFPSSLPEFFIKFLTDEGDLVVDIFSGSNTTGEVCEKLKRRWYGFELSQEYLAASIFRFTESEEESKSYYDRIMNGESVVIRQQQNEEHNDQQQLEITIDIDENI